MTTSAQNLLDKLQGSTSFKKNSGRISAERALSEFGDHLKCLALRHVKKDYSDKYLIDGCFGKTKMLKNNNEANAYCRIHLTVAIKSFDELLKELRGTRQKVSSKDLKRYSELIRDYVFDLRSLVEHLEKQKNPSYEFFRGGKNYGVHTWKVFRLSRQLAVQSAFRGLPFYVDHQTSQIASIFVLRQALEAKFERLIAVQIYNSSGSTPKLRHEFHYKFIASNPSYFTFKSVNFDHLKKIYEWCNEVVHRVYQPFAWQIAFAHSRCGGLFNPVATAAGARYSINNSVEINNLSKMQSAFIEYFNGSYDHGIWCVEAGQPEADVK